MCVRVLPVRAGGERGALSATPPVSSHHRHPGGPWPRPLLLPALPMRRAPMRTRVCVRVPFAPLMGRSVGGGLGMAAGEPEMAPGGKGGRWGWSLGEMCVGSRMGKLLPVPQNIPADLRDPTLRRPPLFLSSCHSFIHTFIHSIFPSFLYHPLSSAPSRRQPGFSPPEWRIFFFFLMNFFLLL